ncbi:gamma carbonic anhydrase family protein [Alphaproteobacteria bacterium]|jgi:carbonic anhydrase/acetyltransferase-like protein (isoleucine patch superfamily)|nr:gamma carbonic anhydrase family protein [Alphaproteobacteria bacterium]
MPIFGPDIKIDETVYLHETSYLYGKITIGAQSSVWPNVVMRAEMHEIIIGEKTNIQDFVMVHVGASTPTIIGNECSITHHVTLHGCDVGDKCLIGINATLMDGSKIGANSIVAGHSIVTENSVFPENSIIAGAPAKLVATRDCAKPNAFNAAFYAQNAKNYAQGIYRIEDLESLIQNM